MRWVYSFLLVIPLSIGFAIFSAKFAALRGTKRKPLPAAVDKVFRCTFLFLLFSPLLLDSVIPKWAAIPALIAYLPSYLDGSEKKTGRPSEWLKSLRIWNW